MGTGAGRQVCMHTGIILLVASRLTLFTLYSRVFGFGKLHHVAIRASSRESEKKLEEDLRCIGPKNQTRVSSNPP